MDTTTQLELISGGRSEAALTTRDHTLPRHLGAVRSDPDWLIDDRTRQRGRQGVAEARAILARAERPDAVTAAGERRAS